MTMAGNTINTGENLIDTESTDLLSETFRKLKKVPYEELDTYIKKERGRSEYSIFCEWEDNYLKSKGWTVEEFYLENYERHLKKQEGRHRLKKMTEENTFNAIRRIPHREMLTEYWEWVRTTDSSVVLHNYTSPEWNKMREEFFSKHNWTGKEFFEEHDKKIESIFQFID